VCAAYSLDIAALLSITSSWLPDFVGIDLASELLCAFAIWDEFTNEVRRIVDTFISATASRANRERIGSYQSPNSFAKSFLEIVWQFCQEPSNDNLTVFLWAIWLHGCRGRSMSDLGSMVLTNRLRKNV
jgi:hypothetical protein